MNQIFALSYDTNSDHGTHDQDVRLLLSPLSRDEIGTVRCLGLNYAAHAKEVSPSSQSLRLDYPDIECLSDRIAISKVPYLVLQARNFHNGAIRPNPCISNGSGG